MSVEEEVIAKSGKYLKYKSIITIRLVFPKKEDRYDIATGRCKNMQKNLNGPGIPVTYPRYAKNRQEI